MPPKAAKGKKPAAAAAAPGPAAALLAAAASTRLQWAPAPGAAGPSTLPPPVVQAEYGTADDDLVRVGPQLGVELLPPHRRGGRAAPAAAPSPAEAPAAAAPAAAGEPDDDEQPDGARIPDLDDVLGWGGGKGVGGLSGDRLPAAWGARSADMCARMPQK